MRENATGLNIAKGCRITLAAYADDIIVMGETEESVIRMAKKLINRGKDIRLQVIDQKTKYLIVSRREHIQE